MKFSAAVAGAWLLFACGSALAQPAPERGLATWAQPVAAPSRPQSEAEKKIGMTEGRALPAAELLQPSLDPALPAYAPDKARLKGHYKAAASDVLPGLVKAWIAAYRKHQPGVVIDVPPPYAGSLGAKELVKQSLDFVFVSRELKPDDITDFQAKFGYAPTSIPVSGGSYRHFGFLDAVGFIVNQDNPLDALSFAQLDAILSSTHHRGGPAITTWGQLGLKGDWADKPIHVYAIKPWNGFEEFIRQRVLSTPGHRGEWRDGLSYSEVVFPIAGEVAKDRYGLGYTGLAYVDAPVKVVALQAAPGGDYVPASYEAVARADYPLSRLIFLNLNKKPGKRLDPAIEDFLRFVLSREGQAIVRQQGMYLPLRADQARQARTAFLNGN
jgi:phosphate transport system substrate-binding protein